MADDEDLQITRINGKFPEYYYLLGVARDATRAQITRRYREIALTLHPDKGGNAEKFAHIANGYQILTSATDRPKYDAKLISREATAERERQREALAEQHRRSAAAAFARGSRSSTGVGKENVPFQHIPDPPGTCTFTPAFGARANTSHHPAPGSFKNTAGRSWSTRFPPYGPDLPPGWTSQTTPPEPWAPPSFGPFGRFQSPIIDYNFTGAWAWEVDRNSPIWEKLTELESACVSLCTLMSSIERLLIELDVIGQAAFPHPLRREYPLHSRFEVPAATWNEAIHGPKEPVQRFHGAKDLLWELLKFLACGYESIKLQLENAQRTSVADADGMMSRKLFSLDRVQIKMMGTEKDIMKCIVMIRDQKAPVANVTQILRKAVQAWEGFVRLPPNLLDGLQLEFRQAGLEGYSSELWQRMNGFYPIEAWKKAPEKPKKGSSFSSSSRRRKKEAKRQDMDTNGEGVPYEDVDYGEIT